LSSMFTFATVSRPAYSVAIASSALIEAVPRAARARRAAPLYWLTQETNETARRLYDGLARYRGFIRYDYSLS